MMSEPSPPSTFLSNLFFSHLKIFSSFAILLIQFVTFNHTIYKLGFSEIRLTIPLQIQSTKTKQEIAATVKSHPTLIQFFNLLINVIDPLMNSWQLLIDQLPLCLENCQFPRRKLCASQEVMCNANLRWFLDDVSGRGSIPSERSRPETIGRLLREDANQLRIIMEYMQPYQLFQLPFGGWVVLISTIGTDCLEAVAFWGAFPLVVNGMPF